jgi:hypothetical protein
MEQRAYFAERALALGSIEKFTAANSMLACDLETARQ